MTADEFNVHYAMLRLTDLRISRDLRVNPATVWRWRKGHTKINPRNAYVLKQYFDTVREELEKENYTYSDQETGGGVQ